MRIDGTKGDNNLHGTSGGDVIYLYQGDDVASGWAGNDLINGGDGNDVLYGNDGNDRLFGGRGADKIYGGDGNDVINGGGGADQLYGGAGADRFIYDFLPADPYGPAENIYDFSFGEGDRIDLSGIDARPDIAGDQAFRFVEGNAFTGGKGEVITFYGRAGDLVIKMVEIDMDGDRYADMSIGIVGGGDMPAAALIL